MCVTNVYTYIYPDGHKETSHQPNYCTHSRHGHTCPNNTVFKHPEQYVTYGTQFPPTPSYTPRTSTPIYASGNESDRSGGYQSAASSSSRRSGGRSKRSSGVYINGKKVYDLDNAHRTTTNSKGERIVLVDGPPTPRTPPQTYTAPHTAPSSPSMPYIIDAPHRRESSSSRRRPVIVDERRRSSSNTSERPRVQVEIVDAKPRVSSSSRSSRHHRNSSASSYESEEAILDRQRRQQERRQKEYEELRDARIRERISAANAKIANRQAVPMTHQPLKRSSTSTTAATAGGSYEADLIDSVHRMGLSDKASRRREREIQKQQEAEDEAQRQRLKERMMPKRRATVGPGSRRTRVLYDDGMYRWE